MSSANFGQITVGKPTVREHPMWQDAPTNTIPWWVGLDRASFGQAANERIPQMERGPEARKVTGYSGPVDDMRSSVRQVPWTPPTTKREHAA
jgi:hypothetical protein